jgi:hypothetical protein
MTIKPKVVEELFKTETHHFIIRFLEECCRNNPYIDDLNKELEKNTSTRLEHWVEYLVMSPSPFVLEKIERIGYSLEEKFEEFNVYTHLSSHFPRIITEHHITPGNGGVALQVESIADFLLQRGIKAEIEGSPYSAFRRSLISKKSGVSLWLIERRGSRTLFPQNSKRDYLELLTTSKELWDTRLRYFDDPNKGMHRIHFLAKGLVEKLGQDLAAWMILSSERLYWLTKCQCAQIQYLRQQLLGFGWSNHLYHVFRSSRSLFPMLVRLFETLGFTIQRYSHAGSKEKWGVLFLKNLQAGLDVLIEVDVLAEELNSNFGHLPLSEKKDLGPIDLWCSLHEDSLLAGGMHHLTIKMIPDNFIKVIKEHATYLSETITPLLYPYQFSTEEELRKVSIKKLENAQQNHKLPIELTEKIKSVGFKGAQLSCVSFDKLS